MAIVRRELTLLGRPARVFEGGAGEALLLIHGGWAGAQMHWSQVWEPLAERYRVIAPDLPGLGALDQAPLADSAGYAAWLAALLEQFGIDRAWCVGNSFGGSLALSLAGRFPGRCAGLVLVNALGLPATPGPLRWFGQTPPGRALMRAIVARVSYQPEALAKAFVDLSRAPAELEAMLARRGGTLVEHFADLLVAGDGPPPPQVTPHLLWGARDRLPGTGPDGARRLQQTLKGATLDLIPDAGHFPQVEQPALFVALLTRLVATTGSSPARAAPDPRA